MADIKDILGVSRDATPGPKAEKPKPEKRIKPKGMSREAFALLSGSHPLMPSQLVGEVTKKSGLAALKEKRKVSSRGQVTYEYQHFDNPARMDGLRLQHWVKCYRDAAGRVTPAETEYNFAKYNKRALVLRYNDEEWDHLIDPEPGWSREETDYLLDLCSLFDLRWMAIADRYEFPGAPARSIEDLKGRYYSLARQLVVGREGGPETVANQSLLKHPYDPRAERERKKGLELLLARSQQQDAEENVILEEARKIDARRRQEEAARQRQAAPAAAAAGPAANGAGPAAAATPSGAAAAAAVPEPAQILEISRDPPPGLSSLFDARGQPTVPTNEVTARATNQRELAEDVMKKINPAKLQKSVEGSMAELGQGAFPRCATRQTCGAYLSLQQEVIQLLDLKRRVQLKQAGLSGPPRKGGVKRADSDTETPRSEKRQRVNKKFADD